MPKLRFPGFGGEWENTELGNLAIYGKDKIKEVASNIKIHHTTETIEMEDTPTVAIKHKKDSSMVVRI